MKHHLGEKEPFDHFAAHQRLWNRVEGEAGYIQGLASRLEALEEKMKVVDLEGDYSVVPMVKREMEDDPLKKLRDTSCAAAKRLNGIWRELLEIYRESGARIGYGSPWSGTLSACEELERTIFALTGEAPSFREKPSPEKEECRHTYTKTETDKWVVRECCECNLVSVSRELASPHRSENWSDWV
jgi:hypothetical protein